MVGFFYRWCQLWWSFHNNLKLLGLAPNLLVLWVGHIPQWEFQKVFTQVTNEVLMLLWHITLWILSSLRWLLGSRAPSLKSEWDSLLLGMCFSLLLSCLSLPLILPSLHSYLSSFIYIPLLVGSSWWEDISYISGSLRIMSLVKGGPTYFICSARAILARPSGLRWVATIQWVGLQFEASLLFSVRTFSHTKYLNRNNIKNMLISLGKK